MGCALTAIVEDGRVTSVQGQSCPIGKNYAEKEVSDPRRIVTSSVKVRGGEIQMLSVKTREDIQKGKIFDCIASLRGIEVKAPVQIGDIIVRNVAGTGVDVIATKTIPIG
jgi:CxxC motif-containing protein